MSDAIAIPIFDARQQPAGFAPLSDRLVQLDVAPCDDEAVVDRYDEGYAAGYSAATAAQEAEVARLTTLLAAATALPDEPAGDVARMIAETVATLVEQIVGTQPSDPAMLETRARDAAALIVEADQARTLWAHPDDVALLTGLGLDLPVNPDPDMPIGSLRIDCATGWIEHGPGPALAALRRALESV